MTLGQVWLRSTLSTGHLRLTALRLSRPVSSSIGETHQTFAIANGLEAGRFWSRI